MDFDISIFYFIFSLFILLISLFIAFFSIFNNQALKQDNRLLKHNVEECYKYIDFLEKEKKEGHYD